MADEKSPTRISHRLFATSCSEMRISMNLSKLMEKLSYTLVSGSVETQVESLTSDSRKVRENTAFVCIVGAVSCLLYTSDAADEL